MSFPAALPSGKHMLSLVRQEPTPMKEKPVVEEVLCQMLF